MSQNKVKYTPNEEEIACLVKIFKEKQLRRKRNGKPAKRPSDESNVRTVTCKELHLNPHFFQESF